MKKLLIGLGIVITATVFAAWPLFGKGFIPTHDGEYHIIRFMEFGRMLGEGHLFPRWAPTLNSGCGLPIFIFHYPFPNYVGVVLHAFGIHYVNAFQIGMAIGYIGAAMGCFFWLRKLFYLRSAVLGTITAFFVPYWFVEIYIRGSIGEIWSLFFLFFVLFSIEEKLNLLTAFGIAGMILSHNILAMLFIPFILIYSYVRKINNCLWIIAGILLSSYFWMPAIFEQQYVVGLNIVNFREHFATWYELLIPSWGSGFSGSMFGNKMSVQIGLVSIIVIITSLFFWKKETDAKVKILLWYLYVGIAVVLFLMLPISKPIWYLLPLLPFIQYPWRLLVFVIPVTAVCSAFIVRRSLPLGIGLALGAIIMSYPYYHPVIYAPRDDAYYQSRKNFTDGTSSMGNTFSTIWTPWKEERSKTDVAIANGKIILKGVKNSYLVKVYTINAGDNAILQVSTLYYPGWTAYIDNKQTPIDYAFDGTIRVAIPPGIHTVTVVFKETLFRLVADIISLTSFLVLIGWGILYIYGYSDRYKSAKIRP